MSKRTNFKTYLVMAVILLGLSCTIAAGEVIYVDADASVGGNGQTWTTAYKYLQDALDDAESGDEIWVAEGTYRPDDDDASHPDGSGLRHATFQLINDVALKGGYAGFGEPDPNARDVKLYETILSGDLNDDDVGFTNNDENSYHVVTGSGTDATALLDGFTITAGNADGGSDHNRGGGMHNANIGGPTVTNCTFSGNWSDYYGGGMYNQQDSSPMVTNCTFSGNWAKWNGGGMYNYSGSSVVTNCTFSGNRADYKGGGMYNQQNSSPMVTNCTFSGNWAELHGGGMYNDNNYSVPTLTNCTFSENTTDNDGGGIYNYYTDLILTNCILWGNSDSGGTDESAQIYDYLATPVVNYCCIQGWTSGGPGNIGEDPLFRDANGLDDIPGTEDDNLRLFAGSPCIDAGDNTAVPADTADLDGDGNTVEPIPWDIDGNPRFVQDPCAPDTGNGVAPIVDIGACERYTFCGDPDHPYPVMDFNHDCIVDFVDFALFAKDWLECTKPECD